MKRLLTGEERPRDLKGALMSAIQRDRDVQSNWTELSTEWEPEEAQILFAEITNLWVTM